MTYSLVVGNEDGTELGVAVASKFLAVGSVVPAASIGAGAIATQALANLRYRPDGLALLARGSSAEQVVAELTATDEGREHRQLGAVDRTGSAASYTGAECLPWAGAVTGPGYAMQGNILAGPEVLEAMERTWLASDPSAPLARRLVTALLAGDRAGGDARGRQSAALLVLHPGGGYGGGSDVAVDLRVDDHADPVAELDRLLDLHDLVFGRPEPDSLLPLSGEVAATVRTLLAALGYAGPDVERSLLTYAAVENLEERLTPGRIDPRLLQYLRAQAARAGAGPAPPAANVPAPRPGDGRADGRGAPR